MIKRILLYNSGGGIGDSIQIIPLIETLRYEIKNVDLHYLCAHKDLFNSSLSDLNIRINNMDLDIKYFGFRWWHSLILKKKIKKYNIEKFDLIVDLQSKIRNSLILKMIPHNFFISPCYNFKLSKPSLNILTKNNKINENILEAMNLAFNKDSKLIDYDISKIDNKFDTEAKRLLPEKNYVGFSITQGNIYRKKEWPLKYIVKTAEVLKEKNKIPVFFVEKKNKELINKIKNLISYAKFPENESEFTSPALVTCLAKRLDFAITIDNGVMHMLSLSKVPMISLFGPTDSEKFAPEYEKSIVLDSKKIHNTKNISAITVEDVLMAAKQHLNFSY